MRHTLPSLLALDLGTNTGWAVSARGRTVSGSLNLRPSKWEGGGMRFVRFRREVLDPLRAAREVIYEEVHRHAGTDAAHIYGGLLATLQMWCEENSIPYRGVGVGVWKKFLGLKGNADKVAVKVRIEELGQKPASFDEADALGILHYGLNGRKTEGA